MIEDFQFNDADGTVITGTANSGPGAHTWLSENTTTVNSRVLNGRFRVQKESPNTQVGNTLDIADVTSWQDLAGGRRPRMVITPARRAVRQSDVRFAFLDNATPSAGSNTITAEMNLDRRGDNTGLMVSGDAGGTGSTATIAGVGNLPFSNSGSTQLRMVLEADASADTYTVYYKDGSNPFVTVGTGNLGIRSGTTIREPRSVRFAFTGTYVAADGEFVDVARIFVTDMNPIPEPGSLALVGIGSCPRFCLGVGAAAERFCAGTKTTGLHGCT